jgi:hypothetical protein
MSAFDELIRHKQRRSPRAASSDRPLTPSPRSRKKSVPAMDSSFVPSTYQQINISRHGNNSRAITLAARRKSCPQLHPSAWQQIAPIAQQDFNSFVTNGRRDKLHQRFSARQTVKPSTVQLADGDHRARARQHTRRASLPKPRLKQRPQNARRKTALHARMNGRTF